MGSYNNRNRSLFRDISGSTVLAVGDDLSTVPRILVALAAKYSIWIQKIEISILVANAATLTFEDNASTPVIIARTPASPPLGPIVFDFGEEGRKLTEGKQFELKNSGAGLVADITWTGYIMPTGTRVPSEV